MVPKIVLDTNVILSAVGWKGSLHQILLELSSIDEIQILSPDRFLALFPLKSR